MKFIEIPKNPFYEMRYRTSGRGGKVREVTLPFYRAIVDELPKGIDSFVITGDLQGREENATTNRLIGEAVAEELQLLSDLGEIRPIDFIVLAGDLYDYPELHKLGGTDDVTEVWNAFAKENSFVVGVLGNHDIVQKSKLAPNTIVLDGDSINCMGVRIGGVSGIVGHGNKNQRKSEQKFISALTKVTRRKNDLILLHQGPHDSKNQQQGTPKITEHLLSNGTSIVAFGHHH